MIKILQGINLEKPITRIKFDLKEETDISILDRIQSFHPLFMDGYTKDGKSIIVDSKLPHLWVEIGNALQKQSNKDWSPDYTEKYIMEVIIKKQISSMSTIPILHSAMQSGLEITQLFLDSGISSDSDLNRRYILGCGTNSEQICSFSSSKDTYLGFMIQRDKTLTNTILDRLSIPAPKWREITQEEDIERYWEEMTKPIVMKPAGLTGGNGVVTKINTLEEAHHAYKLIQEIINSKERQKYQYKILIQEQIKGEDFRLLVIDGKFQIATKRIPAYIVGDGTQTIEQLIATTNKDPRRDITNPTHTLKPIEIDEQLVEYLKDQKIDLEYIPHKDERVYVRKVASMSKGGTTEDFTAQVNPQIISIVETLAKSIHVFGLGVDIMCQDISKPLTPDNGAIIECNTMPEAYLNAFPATGKQYTNIGDIFISHLLSTKTECKRVVYIGKSLNNVFTNLKLTLNSTKTGVYSQGNIYINEEKISQEVETLKAYESLKINASLDTIVHHLTEEEVKEFGLGFDKIDLVVIDNKLSDIKNVLQGYQNLGLIHEIKEY